MNQQNIMQQFFDQQQSNVNGFPGAGFTSNQQMPGSYGNGPTSTSNPYMGIAPARQQNGMTGRFGGSDSESFDVQNSNSQGFSNFMDPRMSVFDPRSRPNYDSNGIIPGMEMMTASSGFSGKMRMNEMAAMFANPAAMAAFQRQRMNMFSQGRENDFISTTNSFGGFGPPHAAQLMQQQRMVAFQRQLQGQLAAQQNQSTCTELTTTSSSISNDTTPNENSNYVLGTFSQQHNSQENALGSGIGTDIKSPQIATVGSPAASIASNHSADLQNKFRNENGRSTPGNSDSQRNAAMVAAAAVRAAAAAAQQKGMSGHASFSSNNTGVNNFPFGSRGYGVNAEQMSPFANRNLQSPDFGSVLSPNKEGQNLGMINASSPLNQGRGTPRSSNPPPPYSPLAHNDSNHSASGSVKGSIPNLATITKSEVNRSMDLFKENKDDQNVQSSDGNENGSTANASDSGLMIAGGATKFGTPATPISLNVSSPAAFPDDDTLNLSPSWPQTPLSPNSQKKLKARASPKQYEQLSKVYDLIDDIEKKQFLERYLAFMSVNGTPVTKLPIVGKQPLDLYTLFRAVCERGGIQEVMERRLFREVLSSLNLPSGNSSLAYLVKSQYTKYLHAYEIKAKDIWMNQWKSSTLSSNFTSAIPTIALNTSLSQTSKLANPSDTFIMASSSQQNWIPNSFTSSSVSNVSSANTTVPGQFGPRMSYGGQGLNHQGLPPYGQQGLPPYGQPDMPGYPGFGGYQNPMFPHGAVQSFNVLRPGLPNDNMSGSWPRGFSPRQGPPELFPEGLQRMPFNHSSRHPLSAFGSTSFPGVGKSRGQIPPISRDHIEQMKYNAHQQQLKLQQIQQQQTKQQLQLQTQSDSHKQQQRFNVPEPPAGKHHPKSSHRPSDVKPASTPTLKRELMFPFDSIENTKPLLKKRKKLTSKDLGPVEAWRIMMSLKSSLVAECTWALDTLNILLADNSTITYFHLNQLPGLLDTLMDHYRRSLANLFGTFQDLEMYLVPKSNENFKLNDSVQQKVNDLWVGVCKNSKPSWTSSIASTAIAASLNEHIDAGKDFWERGGGDSTTHIRTTFPDHDVKLKTFPEGLAYVSHTDEERKRKCSAYQNNKLSNKTVFENSSDLSVDRSTDILFQQQKHDKSNNETDSISEVACMSVLASLLETIKEDEICDERKNENSLVKKLLIDLEFNISYDKKYLEDSKEFIEYLNRRLYREKRENVESEQCIVKQNTPFVGTPDSEKSLLDRCVALSNIFRSLSFIQGNDAQLAGHVGLLLVCGYTLLYKHEHAIIDHSQFKLGLEERFVANNAIPNDKSQFWLDCVFAIRENMLVMLANIGGHLNLATIKKDIHRPIIEGLIHWLTCRSSEALDPLPTAPGHHALSAQRLSMEALAKMTINNSNIELFVDIASEEQLHNIAEVLVKQVARKNPVPTREFALILLDNLARSKQFSKILAFHKSSIRNLVKFVHEAEKNTSNYLSSGGRVQPGLNAEDICGTSISLLRRSVNILLSISKVPCNRQKLTQYTDDILALSTSQMIDTSVLALLAQVLYELSL